MFDSVIGEHLKLFPQLAWSFGNNSVYKSKYTYSNDTYIYICIYTHIQYTYTHTHSIHTHTHRHTHIYTDAYNKSEWRY